MEHKPPLWKFQLSLMHFIQFVGLPDPHPWRNFNPSSGGRGRNGYFQEQLNDDFFAMQWLAISTITIGKHSHLMWRNIWTLTSSKERFKKKGKGWFRFSSISSFSHSSTSWIRSSLCDGTRWAQNHIIDTYKQRTFAKQLLKLKCVVDVFFVSSLMQ